MCSQTCWIASNLVHVVVSMSNCRMSFFLGSEIVPLIICGVEDLQLIFVRPKNSPSFPLHWHTKSEGDSNNQFQATLQTTLIHDKVCQRQAQVFKSLQFLHNHYMLLCTTTCIPLTTADILSTAGIWLWSRCFFFQAQPKMPSISISTSMSHMVAMRHCTRPWIGSKHKSRLWTKFTMSHNGRKI